MVEARAFLCCIWRAFSPSCGILPSRIVDILEREVRPRTKALPGATDEAERNGEDLAPPPLRHDVRATPRSNFDATWVLDMTVERLTHCV